MVFNWDGALTHPYQASSYISGFSQILLFQNVHSGKIFWLKPTIIFNHNFILLLKQEAIQLQKSFV